MLLSFMAEYVRQNTRQQSLLSTSQLQPAVNSSFNSPLQQLPSQNQQREIFGTLQNLDSNQPPIAPESSQSNAAREFSSIHEKIWQIKQFRTQMLRRELINRPQISLNFKGPKARYSLARRRKTFNQAPRHEPGSQDT